MKLFCYLSLVVCFLFTFPSVAGARGKEGMPDLCQVDNTCFPTSTAQLLIWFSRNGYPKLLPDGATEDDRNLGLVHRLMSNTKARFDWGTNLDGAADGIVHYVHSVGYGCSVIYHGISGPAFDPDWLNENNEKDNGFILLLQYVQYNSNDTFSNVLDMGHAVTLVSYDPDTMIIEDTAHLEDEPGRKLISPMTLTHGSLVGDGESYSVSGLILLSGSLLEAPPNSMVMMIGAMRVKMYPSIEAENATAPNVPGSTGQSSSSKSWVDWLFNWLLGS